MVVIIIQLVLLAPVADQRPVQKAKLDLSLPALSCSWRLIFFSFLLDVFDVFIHYGLFSLRMHSAHAAASSDTFVEPFKNHQKA